MSVETEVDVEYRVVLNVDVAAPVPDLWVVVVARDVLMVVDAVVLIDCGVAMVVDVV